ncbi:MAG TPA: hypothetical protein VHC49_21060 [Mycobacteriales bacterium]|nr:hypothetical protein [Mycobacteriales bacterium]
MSSWRDLHDGWTVQAVGASDEPVTATVPGCVHTDLLAAGRIPDPYLDSNEAQLQWIGRTDWRYECTFDWAPDGSQHTDLVCHGLDTIARIELNGQLIGETANMHRSYRFAVEDRLREGSNHLSITFASAIGYAEAMRDQLGDRPGPNSATPEPFNFIRKMACNFGWDWGPVLVTAGIWKSIGLHSWDTARIAGVRPEVEAGGRVRVHVDLAGAAATVRARIGGIEAEITGGGTLELQVPEPRLWWPHGHGDQPLYELQVSAHSGADELDTWSRRIGFRSVVLNTADDAAGSAFTIEINGVPIFARGANWIPDDCFPSRVDRERYRARLLEAREANIDLLRIWGGGLYESDDFYALCDELGILVWQDFLFACAAYPEESPLREEIEAEARENVQRLMPHPSLILWNGNNENIWGHEDWGWKEQLGESTWGAGYYLDLLPRVVAEVDPTRPYWPGSPYSGTMQLHPNDDTHGCMHVWDVWNREDYAVYRNYRPRFVAEFGWQGPPAWSTLERAISDRPLRLESAVLADHQKATDGDRKLRDGLAGHFPEPASIEDWHFATQLNQARAITVGVEYFRSLRGHCMGSIVWQLNDCWPVISWAAVDGDGRRKPLWYALRRSYDPRLLTIQPAAGGLEVVAVNDGRETWTGPIQVQRLDFAGTVRRAEEFELLLDPGSSIRAGLSPEVATAGDPRGELIVARTADRQATWFFAPDRELAYPRPDVDVAVAGTSVTVTARTLVRDLALFVDRVAPAATVDDMLITLLPGESHEFRLSEALDAQRLAAAPVLRCANDLTTGG